MNKKSLTALISTSILLAGAVSTPAFAQNMPGCDPAFAQVARQAQQEKVEEAAKHAEDIWKGHLKQPSWMKNSDGLLTACMNNNWPNFNVSEPMLQRALDGAQERAVKEACNRARDAIADQAGTWDETLSTIDKYSHMTDGDYWDNWDDWDLIGDMPGINLPPALNPNPGTNPNPGWGGGIPGITPPPGPGTGSPPPSSGGVPGVTP